MKKVSTILAAMALPLLGGCEKGSCLEKGYDATVQLIQDYNKGRCDATMNWDRRSFDCPSGQLAGEVNGKTFELGFSSSTLNYDFTQTSLNLMCEHESATIADSRTLQILQQRFKRALGELEVD
jgi:hypothetical protein